MSKSYTIDDDYSDSRLDKWFKNEIINLPHSLLEKILRQNKVKVNKKKTKSSYRLQAGDLIEIELESVSDQKELGQFDETQSGKYIILHLCHHFDEKRSITSLTLVRDTYGRRRK